jgi:transposase-like protein
MAYPLEIKRDAQTQYVVLGLSYEEVAEETGVSLSQLKEWGQEYQWGQARLEHHAQAMRGDAHYVIARADCAERAAKGDPNARNQLLGFEKIELEKRQRGPGEQRALLHALLAFVVERHADAFEQLGAILLEFVEEGDPAIVRLKRWDKTGLRKKIEATTGRVRALATKKSLDQDTLNKIREEIYGLTPASH